MTAEKPVQAVVFDMDGLLLDSERLAIESLTLAGAQLGYDMPLEFCRSLIGMPADRCRELAAEAFGAEFPLDDYFARHDTTLTGLVDQGRLETKTGVFELLDELDRQGIPRAIATSSGRERTVHHLQVAGIGDRFDAIVTRSDVTRGKPHPEPYLTAVAALDADPVHTIAVEDSPNGLRAAHAAGLRCLLIPDLVAPTPETRQLAHRVFPDLHQVIDYITTANAATAPAK
ncbi:HAD family phosphatase [Nocardia sp. CDC159]|uniref:HAD family phosphatase n=1 Tax=Nocardia pulmonis TaxID=2951408 RepID=A0A9X2EH54_9NOCA|nr:MULTISPECIES: HAD family phosphatase [Nocardia]MCM6778608.1 HAD family phosphatase [Nocardia pulmonis]MCM6791497.1 HAD family phosphatase [Nocardia sp. CDC159]